jgi:hypothetical protein
MIGGVNELLRIAPASSLAGSYSSPGEQKLGKTPSDTSCDQMMRGNMSFVAKLNCLQIMATFPAGPIFTVTCRSRAFPADKSEPYFGDPSPRPVSFGPRQELAHSVNVQFPIWLDSTAVT